MSLNKGLVTIDVASGNASDDARIAEGDHAERVQPEGSECDRGRRVGELFRNTDTKCIAMRFAANRRMIRQCECQM